MKFKTTLVLLAVGLALLAVVLYFDSRGAKAKAAEEKTGLLIDLPAADILQASLVKDGETLAFERQADGTWRLTAPLEAAADETEVNGLVDTLAMLAEQAPEHRGVVARELTKKCEEFQRGPARIVLSHYPTKPPKGEITLVIAPRELPRWITW